MPLSLFSTYGTYMRGLLYFLRTGGDFAGCPLLQTDAELPTKVRVCFGGGGVIMDDWIDGSIDRMPERASTMGLGRITTRSRVRLTP
jgi:hypothetical protein